jgi:lycopene beta-cyclase
MPYGSGGFFFNNLNLCLMTVYSNNSFDYLFLGMGAANSLLFMKMHDNGLLNDKKIVIIEPHDDHLNGKNFCFWSSEDEVLRLNLVDLVSSKWKNIEVAGLKKQAISPLLYHHIRGADLNSKIKETLVNHDITFFSEIYNGSPKFYSGQYIINLSETNILVNKVFDSRPPVYKLPLKNQSHLWQSFYGWEIAVDNARLDTTAMVMMDFDIPQNGFCQFIYRLPFDENKMLVEVTRFGNQKISKQEAEEILFAYLGKLNFSYRLIEIEQGVIPMSSIAISNPDYGLNWIYTGTRANMVKPTTGYAFHNMAEDADAHMKSMLNQKDYVRSETKFRFKFYDGLLLKILEKTPNHGKAIFQDLFRHVPIKKVLTFLSEKSTLREDVYIFSKLPLAIFLKVALKDVFYRLSTISPVLLAFLVTFMSIVLYTIGLEKVFWVFLGIGFLSVGLSHGAVDHLIDDKNHIRKHFFKFVVSYLFKGALLGLLWMIWPDIALLAFLAFSAWHFGQADFKEWHLRQGLPSFLWGMTVLFTILFFHLTETISVLKHIKGLNMLQFFEDLSQTHTQIIKGFILIGLLIFWAYTTSKELLLTTFYLLLSSMLPLLASFGIYFVLQHSMHGWGHLKKSLNVNSKQLWIKSLPFSFGGALLIIFFMLANQTDYIGVFFIILSCISMPHVFSMNHLYRKFSLK